MLLYNKIGFFLEIGFFWNFFAAKKIPEKTGFHCIIIFKKISSLQNRNWNVFFGHLGNGDNLIKDEELDIRIRKLSK